MKFALYILFAASSLQAMSKAPPAREIVAESIGVRTLEYEDVKRKRPCLVELWYPTQQTAPFDEPADTVWVHPKEMRNVSVASGKHPLILMSHGHGGDRRDRSWLAETLVRNGFIVASVEHHGNSWRSYNPLTSLRFWERARDVTFILNELFKEPALKGKLDPHQIGFIGYSLGGMTGLALAGAKGHNVKQIVKLQQANYKEIDPELVEKLDFSEAHESFKEPRIRAMALLSPATFIFPPESLKLVKIPVALVVSKGDEVLPFQDHAHQIITHLVPAKLKLLRDKVSHYVFLNRVSDIGKEMLREDLRKESIQLDRLTVHKEVGDFVVEFFKENLP